MGEAVPQHHTRNVIGLNAVHLDEFHHHRAPLPESRALLKDAGTAVRTLKVSDRHPVVNEKGPSA